MRRLSPARALAVLVTVSACKPTETGSALRVSIELESGLRSTCVALALKSEDSTVMTKGARAQGKTLLTAAVFRDDFPATISVQAIGFSDEACTSPTVPPEQSVAVNATFPEKGVSDLSLLVKRSMAGTDADQDGAPADLDCDDRDPQRRPGLPENCSDSKDNDCNLLTDCGDGACTAKQCRRAGSSCSANGLCAEVDCADGEDDDEDGLADCGDSDCENRPCLNGGTCASGVCRSAQSERGLCGDGQDNDGDGMRDCVDPDCDGQTCNDQAACTQGETCQAMMCRGGQTTSCVSPNNVCLATPGICSEALDGGCFYPGLSSSFRCDDGLLCTFDDACDGDGGCEGKQRTCDTPPAGACWDQSGTCDETRDGGCFYSIAVGRLSCTDGNDCTVNDACIADGGCEGAPLDCASAIPPDECQFSTGQCDRGTCQFTARVGACDGGSCQAGVCIRPGVDAGGPFLPPSNVPLATIEAAPPYAHLNFTCSTSISLNPVGTVPSLGCVAPTLPTPQFVPQNDGPTLVVFVVDRLTIASGARVTVVPGASATPADRVPVFAVRGDAVINGALEVSAFFSPVTASGPGGEGAWCPVSVLGTSFARRSGGGQGGAFGERGGKGGRGHNNGGSGAPAMPSNGNATLIPLRGGCPGSRGGSSSSGRYGRAGGAVQVWARGSLTVGGSVLASGGRGLNGQSLTAGGGGGGGGSGGAILLEATTLSIASSAIVAANGAGGAQGAGMVWGADGLPGTADTTQAPGGSGVSACGGAGGAGGARSGQARDGQDGDPNNVCGGGLGGGGGGGGSVGRIRFNSLNRCVVGANPKVSPRATASQGNCSF